MVKRKRKLPTVEEVLSRPWCYYCERDFDDLKILINHQKARHFKCNKCNRRLNTAGGLAVHLSQVHKDQLTEVEGALPNRKGLEVEIFGMEGIPEDARQAHQQRMTEQFFEKQAGRAKDTGNPPPGSGIEVPRKKPITESFEDLDKRFEEWQKARKEFKLNGGVDPMVGIQSNGTVYPPQQPGVSHAAPGAPTFAPPPGQPGYGPPGAPSFQPPNLPSAPGFGLPAQPSGNIGLPQRPPGDLTREVDDLISGAAAEAHSSQADAKKVSKKKKEENVRLVYGESDLSPEEKMATLPKYAYTPPKTEETVLESVTEPGAGAVTGTADEDIMNTS